MAVHDDFITVWKWTMNKLRSVPMQDIWRSSDLAFKMAPPPLLFYRLIRTLVILMRIGPAKQRTRVEDKSGKQVDKGVQRHPVEWIINEIGVESVEVETLTSTSWCRAGSREREEEEEGSVLSEGKKVISVAAGEESSFINIHIPSIKTINSLHLL